MLQNVTQVGKPSTVPNHISLWRCSPEPITLSHCNLEVHELRPRLKRMLKLAAFWLLQMEGGYKLQWLVNCLPGSTSGCIVHKCRSVLLPKCGHLS